MVDFKEIVTHPMATAGAVLAAVATVFQVPFIDAIWAALWANAGTLFTALSVSGFTLAPRLSWLPAKPLTIAAILVGALYVATLLDKFIDSIQTRLKEDSDS